MQKFYLLFFLVILSNSAAIAQIDSLSAKDKAMLDSMMANDEFLKLMQEKEKNSVDISVGVGNGAFSAHNNAANATGIINQLIFTPSVIYRIKNGFSFGLTGFLTDNSAGKTELYQTGINGAYDYYGKKITAGISYTRYVSDRNKYNSKSLYQNDIYGYLKRAKGILQPGLSAGFANGKYKEVVFRSELVTYPIPLSIPRRDTTVLISGYDSTDNASSYFSVSANVSHDFSFYKIFSKDDEFDFTPTLIVNFGSDKLTLTHTNKIFDRLRLKRLQNKRQVESTNKFQLQSAAVSFDFTYSIGKFFLQPNLYLDYYLPETTANRLSTIFSVTAGVSF
ncbi:hypothetical protein [Ferruginibacter sp.]|nr:hypothetical protein [Ferruginibacter sp.]